MKTQTKRILLSSLLAVPALVQAGELEQQMLRCAVIGDASARLGCFDLLSKTAAAITVATGASVSESAAEVGLSVPPIASAKAAPPETPISRMAQRWELDDAAKRGVFAFRPHRDNYLLLANYSTASNDEPFQAFTPGGVKVQHTELTYQLSFKMKMLERLAGTPVDIWFGYTQQSFWQAYNRAASSPFRETNYQPEMMATLPLDKSFGGVDFRYLNVGLVHQSNGQTSTLSRSWNRIYAELGVERGNFGLSARLWKRLDNARSDNDNVDITDYLGHGDLHASYRNDGHELSLTARRNFKSRHGSLQAGWAFPLRSNLKGYMQLFSGYGQSLIDYNYSQKSLGAGFLVDF
ncbi:phospholipase A [Janthinobacterium sp.]|uniref:phospholipase A n=1 Tax=Janthinobacterium sp. TaxID=1871054 RepID=UPI00293D9C0A|nr:phospholipase A [Janthinobacterium sp.]